MSFIIVDKTANTGKIYIDDFGQNCELEENARLFDSKKEAQKTIDFNNWNEWAVIKKSDYKYN